MIPESSYVVKILSFSLLYVVMMLPWVCVCVKSFSKWETYIFFLFFFFLISQGTWQSTMHRVGILQVYV